MSQCLQLNKCDIYHEMKKPLNGGYSCGFLFNPRKLIISRLCSYNLSSFRSRSKISLVFCFNPSGVLFIVISVSSSCTSSDTNSLHLSSFLQQTRQHHSLICRHQQRQGYQIYQILPVQQCKSHYSFTFPHCQIPTIISWLY